MRLGIVLICFGLMLAGCDASGPQAGGTTQPTPPGPIGIGCDGVGPDERCN